MMLPGAFEFGAADSGVYRVARAGLPEGSGATAAPAIVHIDLSGAADRAALMACFANALGFPDWFGANWDALEDCLDDLSWREDVWHVLVVEGWQELRRRAPAEFGMLLEVLAASARYWAGQERGFFALFVDPAGALEPLLAPLQRASGS